MVALPMISGWNWTNTLRRRLVPPHDWGNKKHMDYTKKALDLQTGWLRGMFKKKARTINVSSDANEVVDMPVEGVTFSDLFLPSGATIVFDPYDPNQPTITHDSKVEQSPWPDDRSFERQCPPKEPEEQWLEEPDAMDVAKAVEVDNIQIV